MFAALTISLVGLCFAVLATYIIGNRRREVLLLVGVPILSVMSALVYFSYMSALGYPVEATWEQMPDRISVIYFRVEGQEKITLWMFDQGETRIMRLPFSKGAEDTLEGIRKVVGAGIPVTLKRKQKGLELPGDEEGEGEGDPSKAGKRGKKGWDYEVQSLGDPIDGDGMPPK